jgi:hypothetical protein
LPIQRRLFTHNLVETRSARRDCVNNVAKGKV